MPFKSQTIIGSDVMSKVRRNMSHSVRSEAPEDALWRNVVTQALQDATMEISAILTTQFGRNMARIRDQAREWITAQGKDFKLVCELAGLEASRVHTFAMGKIKEAIQQEHNARAERLAAELSSSAAPGVGLDFAARGPDRHASDPRESSQIGFCENEVLPS
jgi:hypothetical protein